MSLWRRRESGGDQDLKEQPHGHPGYMQCAALHRHHGRRALTLDMDREGQKTCHNHHLQHPDVHGGGGCQTATTRKILTVQDNALQPQKMFHKY